MNEKDYDFTLGQQIAELRGLVIEGFKGVHQRQDTTNGRVLKLETRMAEVEKKQAAEDGRDQGIHMTWGRIVTLVTVASALVGLAISFIPN